MFNFTIWVNTAFIYLFFGDFAPVTWVEFCKHRLVNFYVLSSNWWVCILPTVYSLLNRPSPICQAFHSDSNYRYMVDDLGTSLISKHNNIGCPIANLCDGWSKFIYKELHCIRWRRWQSFFQTMNQNLWLSMLFWLCYHLFSSLCSSQIWHLYAEHYLTWMVTQPFGTAHPTYPCNSGCPRNKFLC